MRRWQRLYLHYNSTLNLSITSPLLAQAQYFDNEHSTLKQLPKRGEYIRDALLNLFLQKIIESLACINKCGILALTLEILQTS